MFGWIKERVYRFCSRSQVPTRVDRIKEAQNDIATGVPSVPVEVYYAVVTFLCDCVWRIEYKSPVQHGEPWAYSKVERACPEHTRGKTLLRLV